MIISPRGVEKTQMMGNQASLHHQRFMQFSKNNSLRGSGVGVSYAGENTVEDRQLGEINNNKSQKFV
tara:strand:+ start:278 stop:478 length:201 start_codon:yes stop_codon:yes gene_type:complete